MPVKACYKSGTQWDVPCCTILSCGTWGQDGQLYHHGTSQVHSGMYRAVPSCPVVREDRMDSCTTMVQVRYTVGRTMLYHPALWYMRTGWTVGTTIVQVRYTVGCTVLYHPTIGWDGQQGLACWESGTQWNVPCCTIVYYSVHEYGTNSSEIAMLDAWYIGGVPCCTILFHDTWGQDGQWD